MTQVEQSHPKLCLPSLRLIFGMRATTQRLMKVNANTTQHIRTISWVDEDGNEYIEEYYPEPYEETILELLEKHTSEFSEAYFNWRQEITSDINERSKAALEITEAKLKELRASKKKD